VPAGAGQIACAQKLLLMRNKSHALICLSVPHQAG